MALPHSGDQSRPLPARVTPTQHPNLLCIWTGPLLEEQRASSRLSLICFTISSALTKYSDTDMVTFSWHW